jgi:hypothetical protein
MQRRVHNYLAPLEEWSCKSIRQKRYSHEGGVYVWQHTERGSRRTALPPCAPVQLGAISKDLECLQQSLDDHVHAPIGANRWR